MNGFPWDQIDDTRDEIARPDFVSDRGSTSPLTDQLADQREAHERITENGIAGATKVRAHDMRPLDDKLSPAASSTTSGDGSSSTTTGSSSSGSSSSSSSGGRPSWFTNWLANRNRGTTVRYIGGGGGGGRLLGPSALGNIPLAGNVPAGSTSTGGGSPLLLFAIVAVVGVGGYFLWHKLRMARHEDKQLDQGKEPDSNAA